METLLPENQQLIADGLSEITELLDSEGITYILEGGTLLGAIRENRFLPWDDDVGMAVPAELFHNRMDKISTSLKKMGFEIGTADKTFENCKLNILKYGARYEILGWYSRGKYHRRDRYRMPSRFLEKRKNISFFGYSFFIPEDEKAFLRHFYGNWQTPKKSGRFFSFLCYDQKYFWKKQIRKLFPFLLKKTT